MCSLQDRSFTFILKTPPASVLLQKAAGVAKGSGTPNSAKVGQVTRAQLKVRSQALCQEVCGLGVLEETVGIETAPESSLVSCRDTLSLASGLSMKDCEAEHRSTLFGSCRMPGKGRPMQGTDLSWINVCCRRLQRQSCQT